MHFQSGHGEPDCFHRLQFVRWVSHAPMSVQKSERCPVCRCFPVFGFMSSMYCYTKSCKEDMPLLLTCLANLISFFMLFGLACVGAEKPDGSDGVTIVAVASMLMSGANAIAIVACLARYNEITRTLIGDPGDADTYVLQKHESILRKDDQMRISFASTLSG